MARRYPQETLKRYRRDYASEPSSYHNGWITGSLA